jgi:hypothetical protein
MKTLTCELCLRGLCRRDVLYFDSLASSTTVASELYTTASLVAQLLGSTAPAVFLSVSSLLIAAVGAIVSSESLVLATGILLVLGHLDARVLSPPPHGCVARPGRMDDRQVC